MFLSFVCLEMSSPSEAFSAQITIKSPSFMYNQFVVFIMIFIRESFPTDFTEELVVSGVVNLDVSLQ